MDQNMNNMGGNMGGKCGCPHHKVIPVLIILLGLVFLLGNIGVFTMGFVGLVWPILVLIAGFTKLTSGKCKCCNRP